MKQSGVTRRAVSKRLGKFPFLSVTTFLFALTAQAQFEEISNQEVPSNRLYRFETKAGSEKPKIIGTLKLSNKKNAIFLEFEGSGLKKGRYKIIRTDDCKKFANVGRNKAHEELYHFETEYGEISGEEKLKNRKIEDLALDDASVALIKINKARDVLVSCGVN